MADGLTLTGIAGCPTERFPRSLGNENEFATGAQRDMWVTHPPPESSYDARLDAEYTEKIIELGTTENGVFGITIHRFQLDDAVRRIQAYLRSHTMAPHNVLASAFPNLSYIWLRRRDKIAQAVSWYKAIQSGNYIKMRGKNTAPMEEVKLEFDYEKIKTYWTALRSSENSWEHFFRENQLRPLIVHYEDLAMNYSGTIGTVLNFLRLEYQGIPSHTPRHEKAADEQSLEWGKRFLAIQSATKKNRC